MATVFLSYSRRSGPVVNALIENLKKLGHDIWYDQELNGGQAWWNEILRQIRGCALFVLVVDPHTLKSEACMREFGYAAALRVPVLPVQVSPDVSPALLPRALSQLQIVRFIESDLETVYPLARALANRPERGPLPDPLPPEPEMPMSYLSGLAERVMDARELTEPEQESLSIDLQRALRNHETADGARELLLRLKDRRELRAPIYRDIDHALADARQVEPAGAVREPATPPDHLKHANPLPRAEPSDPGGGKPPGKPTSGAGHRPARIACAVTGGIIGTIAGVAANVNLPATAGEALIFLSLTGASGLVAGAISGTEMRSMLSGLAGALLAWALVFSLLDTPHPVELGLLAAPVGAVLGAIAGRLAPRSTRTG